MRYAYELPGGQIVWHEQGINDGPVPKFILVEGAHAKRCFRAERTGVPATKGWPITCYASGVHPDQAQELRDTLREAGVPTEVTKGGDPIYTDAAHRRKALKARGFNDRAGYY